MPLAGQLKATQAAELISFFRTFFDPDGLPIDPKGLFRVLAQWEKDTQAAEVQAEVQRQQRDQADEILNKLVVTIFDKGSAYTNVVILAGYAAFFALMPFVKELITPGERKGAILLMLASITTFVGFEVYKITVAQFWVTARIDEFNQHQHDPGFERVDEAHRLQRDLLKIQRIGLYAWKFCILAAVLSGLFALAILAIALLSNPSAI